MREGGGVNVNKMGKNRVAISPIVELWHQNGPQGLGWGGMRRRRRLSHHHNFASASWARCWCDGTGPLTCTRCVACLLCGGANPCQGNTKRNGRQSRGKRQTPPPAATRTSAHPSLLAQHVHNHRTQASSERDGGITPGTASRTVRQGEIKSFGRVCFCVSCFAVSWLFVTLAGFPFWGCFVRLPHGD